mmetsp:Transcript_11607/g.19892  ORF Transcript_11607/g.19892 Transcript_11607/m.19892 type:complete len:343 (+) Transcript_11607:443-1471(+)
MSSITSSTPNTYTTSGATVDHSLTGIFGHMLGTKGPSSYGSSSTAMDVVTTSSWDGTNKVIIITGANTGIGKASAAALASRGAHVIIACRNVGKGELAKTEIIEQYPGSQIDVKELDLASLSSVRKFSDWFLGSGLPLHVLILNAGVMFCPFTLSEDDHELQFATNHLGHFFLTKLLLNTMIESSKPENPGRIVCVSSNSHFLPYSRPIGPIQFDTLDSYATYNRFDAYGQSKLCNILFCRELHRRYSSSNIIATCLHPGSIYTELQRHIPFSSIFMTLGSLLLFKSVEQGAATSVYCAVAQGVAGGEYYVDCNIFPSSRYSHDAEMGNRLWELSEDMIRSK